MKKTKVFVDKVYKLTRNSAPLSFMLPTRNTNRFPLLWFDEEEGTNKALRYAKNQKSPFEDEQDGNFIIEPIIFEDGFLRVPKNNPVLQEFLYYHPLNGKKFVEVNEEKDAAEIVEKLNMEVDALIEARQLTIDQAETIGRVLFGRDTSKTSSAEIKRDILVYAKREPHAFLNILKDPMLKLQSQVQLFFDKSLLSFRNNKKEVWFNLPSNKKKFLTIPFGQDPMYIVSSHLQSEDGIEALKMLENSLND